MPWLTPTVFKQAPDETLMQLPRFGDGPEGVSFRHVVHAYRDTALPVNTSVQAITFETIRDAARFAAADHAVSCIAVTYPGDADLIPPGIVVAPPLKRFVTDVARFNVARQLPLLFDILRNGVAAEWADLASPPSSATRSAGVEYFVMTNSDIHVQPGFYRVLGALIRAGYDVLTVNRRTVDVAPEDRAFSPLFMAERGTDHPGFDCFVFPTSMLGSFIAANSCCGAGHVMRSLLFNLVAHAQRFLMLTHAQMTYHLGDDKYWADPAFADYEEFNQAEAKAVLKKLAKDRGMAKKLANFIAAHEIDVYREALAKRKWYQIF